MNNQRKFQTKVALPAMYICLDGSKTDGLVNLEHEKVKLVQFSTQDIRQGLNKTSFVELIGPRGFNK